MKILSSLVILSIIVCIVNAFDYDLKEDEKITFIRWSNKFNKQYSSSEFQTRFEIFQDNKKYVESINSNTNLSYKLGLNDVADLSHSEFIQLYINDERKDNQGTGKKGKTAKVSSSKLSTLPDSIDWTYLSPIVKNQKQCSSCYAFSTSSVLEALYNKKYLTNLTLSEQQIVDCSLVEGNGGCDGGLEYRTFDYVWDNGGLYEEQYYPYVEAVTECQILESKTLYANIDAYTYVAGESQYLEALATYGPITAGISGKSKSFQLYKSGIYDNIDCGTILDHSVSVLGYGFDSSVDKSFYKFKNSWGTSWGEGGFMRIARNRCGIELDGIYPNVI